jgi:hypothetical protein
MPKEGFLDMGMAELCESGACSVAKDFLEKAGKNDGKFTYSVDGHTFNFLTRGGFSE